VGKPIHQNKTICLLFNITLLLIKKKSFWQALSKHLMPKTFSLFTSRHQKWTWMDGLVPPGRADGVSSSPVLAFKLSSI